MSLPRTLELIARGGHVRRYHTLPTLTMETVGHHSFIVAWLATLLCPTTTPSATLLLAALQHDIAECHTGDLPAPAKRVLNIQTQFAQYEANILAEWSHTNYEDRLLPEELHILKMADSMAGMLTCAHERKLGNAYIDEAYYNFLRYVTAMRPVLSAEIELFNELQWRWQDATNGK